MKRVGAFSIMWTSIFVVGCVPLEQAPLVYSSKQVFGVNVAAGTPDSPGLDVAIGYKGLDAAFVPVVVSKKCPAPGTCPGARYNVEIVRGMNALSAQSLLDDQMAKQYNDGIVAAETIISTAPAQIQTIDRQLAEIAKLPDKRQAYDAIDTTALPASDAAIEDIATPAAVSDTAAQDNIRQKSLLKEQIDRIAKLDGDALTTARDRLQASLDDASRSRTEKSEALRQLLARRDQRTGDDKSDALSVYGSFNGDAAGNKDGANLKLGKVFSTGIAAQNLSQGIARSAQSEAAGKCLAAAAATVALAPTDGQQALLARLLKVCGVPE